MPSAFSRAEALGAWASGSNSISNWRWNGGIRRTLGTNRTTIPNDGCLRQGILTRYSASAHFRLRRCRAITAMSAILSTSVFLSDSEGAARLRGSRRPPRIYRSPTPLQGVFPRTIAASAAEISFLPVYCVRSRANQLTRAIFRSSDECASGVRSLASAFHLICALCLATTISLHSSKQSTGPKPYAGKEG